MVRRKRRGRVKTLRLVLALALAIFVFGVAALYLFGKAGRPVLDRERGSSSGTTDLAGNIMRGEGFDYEATEGGQRLFRIRADGITADKEERYGLENVGLTLWREDGSVYELQSERGTYDLERQRARLQGQVEIEGPNGMMLETEGLELRRRGTLAVSTAPVRLRFAGKYQGSARSLSVNLKRDLVQLAGDVEISSLPGAHPRVVVQGKRLTLDRRDLSLHVEGDVVLRAGESRMEARRLALRFAPDESTLRSASAHWNVEGEMRRTESGETTRLRFVADRLHVLFDEATGEPVSGELERGESSEARIEVEEEGGLLRTIRSPYVVTRFTAGALSELEAIGDVVLEEGLSFAGASRIRRICADELAARVSERGELRYATLEGGVDLLQSGFQARGRRLVSEGDGEVVSLSGDRAWARTPDAQLEAPQILFREREGSVRAEGGVRAQFDRDEAPVFTPTTSETDGRGPVRLEAREAVWDQESGEYAFEEAVRVWQGENFLLTTRLSGTAGGATVAAEGGVRTLWQPPQEVGGEKDAEAPTEDGGVTDADDDAPIEITADRLDYSRATGELVYSGRASVRQGGRTLHCDVIRALRQEEADDLERLSCLGGARIEDPQSGNRVTGDEAVYDPVTGVVKVTGRKVTLIDGRGARIEGRVLTYDLETGSSKMLSHEEIQELDAAETEAAEASG